MKKVITILAILATTFAVAQEATTTVNLILADVISIDGGIAVGGEVDFNFTDVSHYNNGLNVEVPNSLKVTSTSDFDIKVKANGANFSDGTNLIPIDVLTIKALESGSMGGAKSTIILSQSDQALISGSDAGSQLTLDIKYLIPASKSSSSDILGKPTGSYTQTVTYTATAI